MEKKKKVYNWMEIGALRRALFVGLKKNGQNFTSY